MFKIIISLTCTFILIGQQVSADPNINSVSGSISHKVSVTINGSGFGSKNPAAPLMWDDCEGKTVNSDSAVAAVWDEVEPPIRTAAVTEYRTRYRDVNYRGVAAAHSHSETYLAGGHYTYANNNPVYIGSAAQGYKNVMVTADSGVRNKDKWYISYYYRVDPLWLNPCGSYMNHKTDTINSDNDAYGIPGQYVYNMFWGNNAPCSENVHMNVEHASDGCSPTWSSGQNRQVNNPRDGWVKMETGVDGTPGSTNYRAMLVDNVLGHWYENCAAWNTLDGHTRSATIGGYFRWASNLSDTSTYTGRSGGSVAVPANNSFRYFDDMYIDHTFSRVMLTNNQNYSNATIIEPQIPSAWSNNSITCTVNIGKLPTQSTAYLFVFDGNNNRSPGYPVTIGGGGGTTTTTIVDTTPPAPPTGLEIEE